MSAVAVRLAGKGDSDDIFNWRNDTLTRQNSHTTEQVVWQEHVEWFESSLQNPDRMLLMAFLASAPEHSAGVVRFDINDQSALVSINIAPAMRGRKLARPSLQAAMNWLMVARSGIRCVQAQVRCENVISLSLFEGLDFAQTDVKGDIAFLERRLDAQT